MVKYSHLLKLLCVLFLVTISAAQDDETPSPTPKRTPTKTPTTTPPETLEPTTKTPSTTKTTTAKPTVTPTTTRTTTEVPTEAPTTLAPDTSAPTEAPTTTTPTTSTSTTTKKPTTARPKTTELIEEETPEPTTVAPTTTKPAEENSSMTLYIGLGIGGVVILCGIAFLLVKLRQANEDDDDDDDDTYKVTAPTYTKSAPPVPILSANAPPAKPPAAPQYNPYSNVNHPPQRQLQPTSSVPNGSFFNTTSTNRESEFEYESAPVALLQSNPYGYDTDRESEFTSESFIQNPNDHQPVYEFKDSIDSRDSSMSEDHYSPKRNGRERVSSVELKISKSLQMWCLPLASLFFVVQAWEPMPDGYEIIDGPQLRDSNSIQTWRNEWDVWKTRELESIRYDTKGSCSAYNLPSLQWTQKSFIQVFAMMHDRTLYDRERNIYTVDKFLQNLATPVDSVLLWPAYPNLGIDARNQWDFWRVLPGGLTGLRKLVDDFHANNVTVILPYQPWDTATRNENPSKSRYHSDVETLHKFVSLLGADGINGDTMYGVPASFFNCSAPTAVCPEGGVPSNMLSVNPMSWGYFFGFSQFPPVARSKFIEPRHTPLICSRWSLSRTVEFQISFFNGAGYVIWENIWGIWNGMTSREWEELKRITAIFQQFPDALHSSQWKPFVPDLPVSIHGSAFPTNDFTLYTFIHTSPDDYHGEIVLDSHYDPVVVYDLYQGIQLALNDSTPLHIPFDIEGYGYSALLVMSQQTEIPVWIQPFLEKMRKLTDTPLREFSTERQFLKQTMTSLESTQTAIIDATSFSENTLPDIRHLNMIQVEGSQAWTFHADGVQIEPVLKWTPHGDEIYGVGVQFPWESRPSPHHDEELWLDRFEIMKHPVTNGEYYTFLQQSNYTPSDHAQFLQTWEHRTKTLNQRETIYNPIREWKYAQGTEKHPVVHVSIEDAQAFASFYGLRLPHDWEWQYVASNGNDYTIYPWGNETSNDVVAPIQRGDTVELEPVGSYPNGCTKLTKVCDLMGLVWEMTDTFCDSHTCSLLLRGGSLYQPIASSLNDPNWYFPSLHSVQEHGKWLLLSQSYDRSATVGFRCVGDMN